MIYFCKKERTEKASALNTCPHDLDFLLEKTVYKSYNIVIYFLN